MAQVDIMWLPRFVVACLAYVVIVILLVVGAIGMFVVLAVYQILAFISPFSKPYKRNA